MVGREGWQGESPGQVEILETCEKGKALIRVITVGGHRGKEVTGKAKGTWPEVDWVWSAKSLRTGFLFSAPPCTHCSWGFAGSHWISYILFPKTGQSCPWPMLLWALRAASCTGHAGRTQCRAICWPVWTLLGHLDLAGLEATEFSNSLSDPKAPPLGVSPHLGCLEDGLGWWQKFFPPLSPHSASLPHTHNQNCLFLLQMRWC